MANDAWTGARLGSMSDAPLGGLYLAEVVTELGPGTCPQFTDATDRDSKVAAWVAAGNTLRQGMRCYTISDGRYWRLTATSPATWTYDGGNPPPLVLATVVTGSTAITNYAPVVCKDSSGFVHVMGGITNNIAYTTGSGVHNLITLPAGYRPPMQITCEVNVLGQPVGAQILADGTLKVLDARNLSIPVNTPHLFDNLIQFHPGYSGGALP